MSSQSRDTTTGTAGEQSQDTTTGTASERYYRRLLELGGRNELGPLLDAALALAVEVTGSECAYLELYDEHDQEPQFWRAHGLDTNAVGAIRAGISRGIIARAVAGGEAIETESAVDDERFSTFGSVREHSIRAVLCVPIGNAPPIGVLYLQRSEREGAFSTVDRDRLELFARQLTPLADRLISHATRDRGEHDHTAEIRRRFSCPEIVGRSAALARVLQQAALVAPHDIDVLITGRPGTGKTALARAIALNSERAARPFVALNCAAIQDSLFESELFGAERGSHSQATKRLPGKVEAAEGGTLFLDEVGELTLAAQAKLLHLLQAREYYPLGATVALKADIRIIAATNADLRQRIAAGLFREDLYWRLNVMPIDFPSLAERRDDVLPIAEQIVRDVCRRHGFPPMTLSRRVALACREEAWAGNVRELAHAIEAGIIRARGDKSDLVLQHHVFPTATANDTTEPATFQEATRQFQRRYLLEALDANDWNIRATSRQLDLTRAHVYNLIQIHGLARR